MNKKKKKTITNIKKNELKKSKYKMFYLITDGRHLQLHVCNYLLAKSHIV